MRVINQQERQDMFWRFFYLYLASFMLVGYLVYHNTKVPAFDKTSCKELDLKNLHIESLNRMGNTLLSLDKTSKSESTSYENYKASFEQESAKFRLIDTSKYRDLFQIYTVLAAYYRAIENKGAAAAQIQDNLKLQYDAELAKKDAQIQQLTLMIAMAKGGGGAPPPPAPVAAAGGGGGNDTKFKSKMVQSAMEIESKIAQIKQSVNLDVGSAKCNVEKVVVNQILEELQRTATTLKSN